MAVLVDENTKVICQGLTGSQGKRLRHLRPAPLRGGFHP